ncbi:DUF2783 domain-containing protein [Amaricoccus sp.]|uniref:DUF2783 domain-containing protein n=1 Tax=Amaricoccus sp. TaxID=1872485 RepID=UPI001B4469C8|nr:DUF2783 domain-containing protein [Amaricoccus sp.]MBP7240897.1 DUF2783 domain-containing protein [Amaricoccus sp.]
MTSGNLDLAPNLTGADDVYEALVDLTDGLDETASLRAQARLILILINHLNDRETVLQAIRVARRPASDRHG